MGLDSHRTKLGAGLILGTLGLCALFLAQGSMRLLAARQLPVRSDGAGGTAPSGPIAPAPGSQPPDIKAILARNMFDPSTGPLWPPPPPPAVEEEGGEESTEELDPQTDGSMPPACEGQLKMVGAIYAPTHPEWSFAVLGGASGAPLLYRIGASFESKVVNAIYPKAVFLQEGSKLCSLTMFGEAPGAAKPAAKPAAAEPTASAPTPGADEYAEGITKVSDTQYTIKRALVDKVLANQAELMRSARIVPHEQNGKVVGVKLYGIRRKSLLGALGLQNGDLLRTINGFDMSSPDTALEAYSRLRSADNLTLAVTRRGRATNMEYGIQE